MKKRSGFSAFAALVALFLTIGAFAQQNQRNLIAQPLQFSNTIHPNMQLTAFSGTEKQPDLHLDLYKRRSGRGSSPRLRNTGIVFTALGVATMVAGAIMVKQAAGQTYYYANADGSGTTEEGSIKGAFGALGIVGGAISTAGGGLMWFFGQRKLNH